MRWQRFGNSFCFGYFFWVLMVDFIVVAHEADLVGGFAVFPPAHVHIDMATKVRTVNVVIATVCALPVKGLLEENVVDGMPTRLCRAKM